MFSRTKPIVSVGFRALSVGASLAISILVAKHLSLTQIAYYFLYITLAYIGNAALYVGLGVVLQRMCVLLASSNRLSRALIVRYVLLSCAFGGSSVFLLSGSYFYARGSETALWVVAGCCAMLSSANFVSATAKDLLALGRHLNLASFFGFLEQLLRAAFIAFVLMIHSDVNALKLVVATALASLLSGALGIFTLFLNTTEAHKSLVPGFSLKTVATSVAPVGLSGLLNWFQLQSYRPALLFFGYNADLIGIVSLLTTLGMTGANPVLAITAQTYIPKVYAKDIYAFRQCITALLKATLLLVILSIPAAVAFLTFSGRQNLMTYWLLVPLGVLVEAGNNVAGVYMHRLNVIGHSMWSLPLAGFSGVVVAVSAWFFSPSLSIFPYLVAGAMVLSQVVVLTTLAYSVKRSRQY